MKGVVLVFLALLCCVDSYNNYYPKVKEIGRRRNNKNTEDVRKIDESALWKPKKGTREEFMKYKGMTKETYERVKLKIKELKLLSIKAAGRTPTHDIPDDLDTFGDVVLTEKQLDHMIDQLKTRRKRKMLNFKTYPEAKWNLTIPYMYDGGHTSSERTIIRSAMTNIEQNTCLTFIQITYESQIPTGSTYILFTRESSGCWSYWGRLVDEDGATTAQPLNLESGCLKDQIGIALGRIGSTLGFAHEHGRPDRNSYVDIYPDNIQEEYLDEFYYYTSDVVNTQGIPYDYSSIMQYSPESFSIDPSRYDTMCPVDASFVPHMGQTTRMTFFDFKSLNMAYCNDSCNRAITCYVDGYIDPNNCYQCKCPDGFGGSYCQTVEPSSSSCDITYADAVLLATNDTKCISTPGYDFGDAYPLQASCNWHIDAPFGYCIDITFPEKMYFIQFIDSQVCNHWVEVKYKGKFSYPGRRFCEFDSSPNLAYGRIKTEANRAVVTFRSYYDYTDYYYKGFKLCYKLSPCEKNSAEEQATQGKCRNDSNTSNLEMLLLLSTVFISFILSLGF